MPVRSSRQPRRRDFRLAHRGRGLGKTARSTAGGLTGVAGQDLGTGRILPGDMAFANASVGILLTSRYPAMFTTANGGQTWTPQRQAPVARSVAWLTPTTAVAANVNGQVVRSTDGGVAWTLVYTAGYGETMAVRLANSGHGMGAGNCGHVLHSTDGGVTWHDPQERHVRLAARRHDTDDTSNIAVGSRGIAMRREP